MLSESNTSLSTSSSIHCYDNFKKIYQLCNAAIDNNLDIIIYNRALQ